jgi:hypothetical protein
MRSRSDDERPFRTIRFASGPLFPSPEETEVHRAKNLKRSVYLENPSEDGAPREKRGIDPFKSLLEFFRVHPFGDLWDVFHIIEISLTCQYPPLLY